MTAPAGAAESSGESARASRASRSGRLARLALLSLLLGTMFAVCPRAWADKLYLQSGAVIEVDRWWVDGDTLSYENSSGTVGLPRSLVVRIEPTRKDRATGATNPQKAAAQPAPSWDAASRDAEIRKAMREGSDALSRRDFEEAESRFEAVLDSNPDLAGARVGVAMAQIAQGEDDRALGVVLDGLAKNPENADLHELLGDLQNRQEQVEDALASWKEAFRLDPNDRRRDKIFKAERELHAARDYSFSTTPHFNLRHDGDLDPDLAASVADYLETRFRDLSDLFRHAPSQPITVLLYPNRQFRDVTQAPNQVIGLYDGKIRVPLGGIKTLSEPAKKVLVHELTHAFIHSKTRGNCPKWLHEGLAQRSEERTITRADRDKVRQLVQSGAPEAWESREFSYPAALSLAQYLESLKGFDGILDVLDTLGTGASIDDALQQTYGFGYAGLCRRWAQHMGGASR